MGYVFSLVIYLVALAVTLYTRSHPTLVDQERNWIEEHGQGIDYR
jgi:hypothetical protein